MSCWAAKYYIFRAQVPKKGSLVCPAESTFTTALLSHLTRMCQPDHMGLESNHYVDHFHANSDHIFLIAGDR